jgi:DNA repair protein RadC
MGVLMSSVVQLCPEKRALERLLEEGPEPLSDAEVLGLLLRSGPVGLPVEVLSHRLLEAQGSLAALAGLEDAPPALGAWLDRARLGQLHAAMEFARRVLACRMRAGAKVMSDPGVVRQYLTLSYRQYEREVFSCLYLDSQHRLIRMEALFMGTLDGASVYPREVVALALRLGAAAVILAHNHPSGVAEPSLADIRVTEQLQKALDLVSVRVLDHMVIGDGEVVSFAERGLLG